jgi:hypothetical protein
MLYLLGDYLVRKLLDFDVTIHANFLREFFGGMDPLTFFDSNCMFVCTAPAKSKLYLERSLRHIMLNDPYLEEESLAGETVLYTFEHLERNVQVRILFQNADAGNLPSSSFPQPDIDVNRLSVKRDGLSVNACKEPSILYTLPRQCKEKRFRLLDPNINPNWKVVRAKRMLKQGWRMINSAVQKAAEDDKCSICQGDFKEAIITRCTHCYCKGCWKRYVKSQTVRNPLQAVSFIHPASVACPMCRHEMELWETLV